MHNLAEENGMSLNFKINGEVCSFKSGSDLVDHLKIEIVDLKRPLLGIESLDSKGENYDHMQEILELTYRGIPYMKGIQAMAYYIQDTGNLHEFSSLDISWLGIRCKEILDELMEIADAAEEVYESDCRYQKLREKHAEVRA